MSPELQAFASGFPVTLLHAAVSLLIWALGVVVYLSASSLRERGRLAAPPPADCVTLGSALLGLALPLAVSLAASASLVEIGLWGLVLVVLQLLLFRIVDLILQRAAAGAATGRLEAAWLLAAARIGSSVILAAAVAG